MSRDAFILALGGLVLLWYKTRQQAGMIAWDPPKSAQPYLPLINQAEAHYNLPPTLLARVLDIESAYRPDIINGTTKSPAGALGIAQIIPRWHPDVDPLNPLEAIPYAAKYLNSLKAMFGTWPKAVAAYNWGPGNLKRYINGEIPSLPTETKNYLLKIWPELTV